METFEEVNGMCGTCKYRQDGICKNNDSYLAHEIVGLDDMCDEWEESKGVRRWRESCQQ